MLTSLSWLRDLCPFDASAEAVARLLTARGLTVDSIEVGALDTLYDIDVPANRPDCLGHRGIAREISAALGVPLKSEAAGNLKIGESDSIRVEIEAPELCGRYTAAVVRGVRIGPSPGWIVERLEACGLRPINNAVDISNLVLLELGHPVHFFDLAQVRGGVIRVRRAASGERLATLDGETRDLDPEMLVIADQSRSLALAGIIGGADSEIRESSHDVLVEAAWFEPTSVRRTRRRLGIQTDASHRFERGADPAAPLAAQAMAARLLGEFAGGSPEGVVVDCHPTPKQEQIARLGLAQIHRLLGYAPSDSAILDGLAALGFSPVVREAGHVQVTVPSYRVDVEREADLVEEVARHIGYDEIPTLPPVMDRSSPSSSAPQIEEISRDYLSARGFHEGCGYSMIGSEEDSPFVPAASDGPLNLTNPIAEGLTALRRSLLPGLLAAVDRNQRRGVNDVRLFEVGRVFLARGHGEFPDEPSRVGVAWSGAASPRHWSGESREADLFDLIGLVEGLIRILRPALSVERVRGAISAFHPGQCVTWRVEGLGPVATGGSLHPERAADLARSVLLAEVDLGQLGRVAPVAVRQAPLPRLTPVTRDLALVVKRSSSFAEILQVASSIPSPAPVAFDALDRYSGPPLAADELSLTLRITLQPSERTLTDAEIEEFRAAVLDRLENRLELRLRE